MIKTKIINFTEIKKNLVFILFLLSLLNGYSQDSFLITFPSAPDDITSCSSSGLLTVRMTVITASTTGASARINFPNNVNYVTGSINTTSGNFSLQDDNVSNLNSPTFITIASNNVLNIGDFTEFTVERISICGAPNNDNDEVIGSISGANDVSNSSGVYNILKPFITINAPSNIVNATIGASYDRDFTIVNSGLGCTDDVYFDIDYGSSGYQHNSITLDPSGLNIILTPLSNTGNIYHYLVNNTNLNPAGFCNGDILELRENIILTSCPTDDTSYYTGWGCAAPRADWCAVSTTTGTVTMASGVPNIGVSALNVIQHSNFDDPAIYELTYTNTGTEALPGAGTAFNFIQTMALTFGQANVIRRNLAYQNFQLSDGAGGFTALTFTGGTGAISVNKTPAVIDMSQLTASSGSGFIDADGDGQFDDLPVGASFTLRFEILVDCDEACGTQNLSGTTRFFSTFTDQCDTLINSQTTQPTGGTAPNFENRHPFTSSSVNVPANVLDGVQFTVRVEANRNFALEFYDCPTNQTTINFQIPKGYTASAGRFFNNFTSSTNSPSLTVIPGTGDYDTVLVSGAAGSAANLEFIAAEIDLTLDCASFPNELPITYTYEYECDAGATNSCVQILDCGSYEPNTQCPAPCPEGGLTMLRSDFERQTTGYVSPYDSSMRADITTLSDAQLNIVAAFDEVKGVFDGELKVRTDPGVLTEHFYRLTYPQIGAANVLVPGAAVLTLTPSGGGAPTSCNLASPASDSVVAGNHVILYNLSACGIATAGDLVTLEVDFTVVDNPNLEVLPTQVPELISEFFSRTTPTSAEFSCSTFSGDLRAHRIGINNLFVSTGDVENTGCTNYQVTNSISNEEGVSVRDVYPGEVRSQGIVESIVIEILNEDAFNGLFQMVWTGSVEDGLVGSTAFDLSPFVVLSNNDKTATITNDGTWPLSEYSSGGTTRVHVFRYNFTTSCATVSDGNIRFRYNYKEDGYALQVNQSDIAKVGEERVLTTLGELSVINLSSTIDATQLLESVDFRLESLNSNAVPYTWVAIPNAPGVSVQSVTEISSGTVLTPTAYANGVWFPLDAAGLFGGATEDYRIEFTYTNCNPFTFNILAGWDCNSFPSDPLSACDPIEGVISVIPQNGNIEIIPITQPTNIDLCTPNSYEYQYLSNGNGTVNSTLFQVITPTGLNLDNSTVRVEYPIGSGNIEQLAVTTNLNENSIDLSTHSNFPNSGNIPGLLTDSGNSNVRAFNISFDLTATCEFTAGDNFQLSLSANNLCGSTSNGSNMITTTPNININGVDSLYSVSHDLQIDSGNFTTCAGTLELLGKGTIISSGSLTGSNGFMDIEIIPGYEYVSFTPTTGTFQPTLLSINTNIAGQDVVRLSIPSGMSSGNSFGYTLEIKEDLTSPAACGNNMIKVTSNDQIGNTPCVLEPSNFCDTSPVITGEKEFDFTVERANLEISLSDITATVNGSNEDVTLNYDVDNTSVTVDSSLNTIVQVYRDVNENGVFDSGTDILITTDTLPNSINAGTSISASITYTVNPSDSCKPLLLMINRSANPCICNTSTLAINPPTILNGIAGSDLTICESEALILGHTNNTSYNYRWIGLSNDLDFLSNTSTAQPEFKYTGSRLTASRTINYTLEVTKPDGCTSTDDVIITINPQDGSVSSCNCNAGAADAPMLGN